MLWLLRFGVVVTVLGPTLLLAFQPELYDNALVAFLLSVAIAAVSVVLSREEFLGVAKRRTQTEWLTQAESACDRLLTTCSQVARLRLRSASSCGDATESLPELKNEDLRAVRMLIERNCEHTAAQLLDITQHLESAVLDWQRFIRKNCEGKDCELIGAELERRRVALWRDIPRAQAPDCEIVELKTDGVSTSGAASG